MKSFLFRMYGFSGLQELMEISWLFYRLGSDRHRPEGALRRLGRQILPPPHPFCGATVLRCRLRLLGAVSALLGVPAGLRTLGDEERPVFRDLRGADLRRAEAVRARGRFRQSKRSIPRVLHNLTAVLHRTSRGTVVCLAITGDPALLSLCAWWLNPWSLLLLGASGLVFQTISLLGEGTYRPGFLTFGIMGLIIGALYVLFGRRHP